MNRDTPDRMTAGGVFVPYPRWYILAAHPPDGAGDSPSVFEDWY